MMSQQTDTILFLSTPSARRATGRKAFLNPLPQHFYPRPPRGGRRPLTCAFDISSQFLSTPSARRATFCCSTPNRCIRHFYPRPPRGGRQLHVVRELTNLKISIHALREEGDVIDSCIIKRCWNFYPRPPRGGRLLDFFIFLIPRLFLSTPSARRATIKAFSKILYSLFLSTPSARRATIEAGWSVLDHPFLSTPSARRATLPTCGRHLPPAISIHALREEGDQVRDIQHGYNPFLSTPSARRATVKIRTIIHR